MVVDLHTEEAQVDTEEVQVDTEEAQVDTEAGQVVSSSYRIFLSPKAMSADSICLVSSVFSSLNVYSPL